MALQISNLANQYDPSSPFKAAYARIVQLNINVRTGEGGASLAVFASKEAADAGAPPIDQAVVLFGQPIQGTDPPEVTATLAELMARPEFAAAYAVIAQVIYDEARRMPPFSGSKNV